ncbi:MAG: ABC transporter permease, partial [Anaerotignum sp.]|nr:ABC transporter permease [Anaerotignum sp.]
RATGANPNMSRAQGISTDLCKVIALALSNGLVAVCGALIAQYQGNADVNMGRGAIVIGLAAVIIGEVVLGRWVYFNYMLRMAAVVFGAIMYFCVIAVVLWLGLETTDMKLISALIVALFLAVPYLKGKYDASHVKRGGGKNA